MPKEKKEWEITGEYKSVSRKLWKNFPEEWKIHKELMSTPCTEDEAIEILEFLSRISGREMPELKFNSKWGESSEKKWRIRLPNGAKSGEGEWANFLRVGIVVHEWTHLISPTEEKIGKNGWPWRDMHGDKFVRALAEQIKIAEPVCPRPKLKKAAGASS